MLGAKPILHQHTWVPYCGPFPQPGWTQVERWGPVRFFMQVKCVDPACGAKDQGDLEAPAPLTAAKVRDAVTQMNTRRS